MKMEKEGILPTVLQVTPEAANMLEGMDACDNLLMEADSDDV